MKKRINRSRRRTIHFHVHGSTGYYNYVTCNAKELSHVLNMHSLPQLPGQPLSFALNSSLFQAFVGKGYFNRLNKTTVFERLLGQTRVHSFSSILLRAGWEGGKKSKRGWYPSLLRVFSFKKSKARFLRYILGFRADKCQW